jgi:hypothetical protein
VPVQAFSWLRTASKQRRQSQTKNKDSEVKTVVIKIVDWAIMRLKQTPYLFDASFQRSSQWLHNEPSFKTHWNKLTVSEIIGLGTNIEAAPYISPRMADLESSHPLPTSKRPLPQISTTLESNLGIFQYSIFKL